MVYQESKSSSSAYCTCHWLAVLFASSVCTPPVSYSAIRCCVANASQCISRSHSIIYDPHPPALTQQVSQYVECITWPTVNKHREMNCVPFTVFISFVSHCSQAHHYQTAFTFFEYIWQTNIPSDGTQGDGNSQCVCVEKMCALNFEKNAR